MKMHPMELGNGGTGKWERGNLGNGGLGNWKQGNGGTGKRGTGKTKAALSAITMKTSPIDAETLEQLGEGDRAVLQGFSPEQMLEKPQTSSARHRASDVSSLSSSSDIGDHAEELVTEVEKHLEDPATRHVPAPPIPHHLPSPRGGDMF